MPLALRLTLAELASAEVVTIAASSSVAEAVRLMAERKVSCLLVIESGRPVGILTERDVICLAHGRVSPAKEVRSVMSGPLLTAPGDLDFRSGHLLLIRHGIRHLVVLDSGGDLLGIVSESDFRAHFGQDVYSRLHGLDSVMESNHVRLAPDRTVAEALARMVAHRLEYVLIADGDQVLGILTERDLPRLLARYAEPAGMPLREVMSSPLLAIPVDTAVSEAVERMARHGIRHMAVTDAGGEVLGIVSQHRLVERLGLLFLEDGRIHAETRLAWLLDATEVGTWEYDHASDKLSCDGALGAMLTECGALDDFNAWLSALLIEEPAGVPYWTADYQMQSPAGGVRWLALRGQASRLGETGRAVFSAGIAFEVTEAKRLQRDLEAERTRLRTLIQTVPNLIWLKDPDGVYLSCNTMFERLFGAAEADIIGKTDYDFLERRQADVFRDGDRRAMLAGKPTTSEEWVVFADDGHKALMETIKTPMYDTDGLLIGVLGIARDITANYLNQQQLTTQVAELRRWHDATLGREMRILELKREVNALLSERGQLPRYQSATEAAAKMEGDVPE